MSHPYGYDDEPDDVRRRRHAIWGLSVLVMIAIIIVTFLVLFTGSRGGGPNEVVGIDDGTLPGALPVTSQSSAAQSLPSETTPVRPSPSVDPSVADVADGINRLRAQVQLPLVTATHSRNADECAASRGAGPTCVPHYMYAQVDTKDAGATLIALENVNREWLLDATTRRIEIGWARLPSGGFECAVLKFP